MTRLFSALHLRSLRVEVFLWTIAPLTILLILFSLTGIGAHQASMRQMAGDENTRLLSVMADALASQVANKTASVRAAAELLGHDFADPAMRSSHLEAAARVLAGSDLLLIDSAGMVLGSAPAALTELDVSQLLAAEMTGEMTVTHTADGPLAVWRIDVPEQAASLLAGEPLAALVQSSGLALPGSVHNSALALLSSDGQLLYQVGDLSAAAPVAAAEGASTETMAGASGAMFERIGGVEYATTVAAVPSTDWRLLLREPWLGLNTPPILLEQLTPFVLLIAVVVSFLTLLFGLLFVVRPLRLLSDRTRRIGEGDFGAASTPVGGVDEIEDLRRAVDQMAAQIQSYQVGLQSYLHAVTRAQEEERSRLARELHDETIQTLTALDHKVQKLQRASDRASERGPDRGPEREPERGSGRVPAQLEQSIEELHQMVSRATGEVRRFSRALRPLYLEDLGLAPALELLAKESGAGFTLVGAPRRLSPDVELALYRIAQESLNNARRHAAAAQIEVAVAFGPQRVRLTVSDDGRGFDLPPDLAALARSGHFGLMGMQERAQLAGARLELDTAPDQGTSVTVTVAG